MHRPVTDLGKAAIGHESCNSESLAAMDVTKLQIDSLSDAGLYLTGPARTIINFYISEGLVDVPKVL